ncbi:quinone oxidoreductase-like protein 2 homolog [Gigantopelta aegis]|uniref:quinone oxidoreductase-like protein 2 homolog n=1 Tax=Gigantopelta aegis TaxID=1735272 RepID=UPI001B8884E4|nr:quinone oxidoreductase-like protein 2 homolog [Gigantopelta aegis]
MAFKTPPEVLLRSVLRNPRTSLCSIHVGQTQPRFQRAAVCFQLGKPLEIKQISVSDKPGRGQVLINVHAVGVNFSDILACQGKYQVKAELPFVPGYEVAGEVAGVGEDVHMFKRGDSVLAVSTDGIGAFSDSFITDQKLVHPVPEGVSKTKAAATLVSYATALVGLTRKAAVKPGETVVVTAAAGSTGLATVDLAAHSLGAKVIGVCGGSEKTALVLERGAHFAVDYKCENVRDRLKDLTKGKGVNVVIDHVGGDLFMQCLKSLAPEGRLVTVGYASGKIPDIPANLLLLKQCSVIGLFWGQTAVTNPPVFFQSMAQVLAALKDKKIDPYCGKTFPLEQINEAFDYVLQGKSMGKVIIELK